MKNMSRGRKILLALVVLLVLAQFKRIDKTNPSIDPKQTFSASVDIPSDVKAILSDACYDCHSNETEYPWYSNVAPISWWLKGHVKEARKNVNFSEWTSLSAEDKKYKLNECIEEIKNGSMPPSSFKLAHPEARLSDEQKQKLLDWLVSNS